MGRWDEARAAVLQARKLSLDYGTRSEVGLAQMTLAPGRPSHSALPPTLAPRLLKRGESAAHVSVSPNTFDKMVIEGTMPRPRLLRGSRKAWDILDLNRAVDALPRDGGDEDEHGWADVDDA